MKQYLFLIFTGAALLLVSCQKKEQAQASFSDNITETKDTLYVNNKAFNGQIWSEDSLISQEVEDGKTTCIRYYHLNGQVALEQEVDGRTYGDKTFYDEEGNKMEEIAFMRKYLKLTMMHNASLAKMKDPLTDEANEREASLNATKDITQAPDQRVIKEKVNSEFK